VNGFNDLVDEQKDLIHEDISTDDLIYVDPYYPHHQEPQDHEPVHKDAPVPEPKMPEPAKPAFSHAQYIYNLDSIIADIKTAHNNRLVGVEKAHS